MSAIGDEQAGEIKETMGFLPWASTCTAVVVTMMGTWEKELA